MPLHCSRAAWLRCHFSYQLDDAPAYERFLFATSLDDFDVETVLRATEAIAAGAGAGQADLPLPENIAQVSFMLEKE